MERLDEVRGMARWRCGRGKKDGVAPFIHVTLPAEELGTLLADGQGLQERSLE